MIETNERRSDVVATERYASDGDLFNLSLTRRQSRQSRQSRQRNEKEKRIVIHHERTDTDE